jgi:hypothetical protein
VYKFHTRWKDKVTANVKANGWVSFIIYSFVPLLSQRQPESHLIVLT